jgi:AAA family ATP:ADP antiporter
MANGRLHKFLNHFADVRGHEAHAALYLSGYFFLITFAFYIIKPVKESFLITRTSPAWWPYADLATALLIGFVVALNARLLGRLHRRIYLSGTMLFFVACLFAFWFVFDVYQQSLVMTPVADPSSVIFSVLLQFVIRDSWPVPVIAFSFWSDVFIAMSITQFWIAVNDIFNPYQGKRLVGLFITGGLVGGIAGSLLAGLMVFAHAISAENLLLVCPALLLLALTMINLVYAEQRKLREEGSDPPPTRSASKVGYLESFRAVRGNRYLLLLAGVLFSAMVAGSLINFQFKTVVRDRIEAADDRTSFLALFFLAVLVASTVFHLSTTGRVLKNFGIRAALLVGPVLLLAGSAAVYAVPAGLLMVWAAAVRGGDKIFDNTISQSVRELLYIPVSSEFKYKAKIFIDMFVNKAATGFGAALFLTLYHLRGFLYKDAATQVREIGFLVLAVIGLWIVLIGVAYAGYPAELKKDIRRRWADGDKVVSEHIDIDRTRRVFDTIQSREKSSTLYVMNMFDIIRKDSLTPELKEILGFKQDELRARSMDSLLDVGGEVFFQGFEDTLADKGFETQVSEVFALPAYQDLMRKRLAEIVGSASEVERMEAAKLIGMMTPTPWVREALAGLLRDPSAEVVTYALSSAAVHLEAEHVPLILCHLANPMTTQVAQEALAAYGPGIEDLLSPALRDDGSSPQIRRAIPEVLARIGTQKSADILLAELARRREDVEQELIAALYMIRSTRPGVLFPDKSVRQELLFLIGKAYDAFLRESGAAAAERAAAPGGEAQAEKDGRIRRVFDLLTLSHPHEDIVKAYQNILQGNRKSTDFSLGLLDDLLDRELKALIFPLVEDLPPEERIQRMKKALRLK